MKNQSTYSIVEGAIHAAKRVGNKTWRETIDRNQADREFVQTYFRRLNTCPRRCLPNILGTNNAKEQ